MFKIDGPNTLVGMPARGAVGALPGWFQQAPGAGTGTVVTGEFMNMLQAEILAVLAAAGIVPDKADDTQLLQAIQSFLGPSSWTTGDVKLTLKTVADAGWLMMNDGTIGSATSGATFANAGAQPLYVLIWNNVPDADAPVTGGRGGSGAADFAANKPMALTKALGRAIAIAGAGAGLTARTLGKALGAETHNHGGSVPAHDGLQVQPAGNQGSSSATSHPNHTHAISADTTMQPTTFLNAMIKL